MVEQFKDNALYHYCTLDTAIRFILPNRQLRVGPLINTNDPRENKSLIFGSILQDATSSASPDELIQMNQIVSDTIRDDCKVYCSINASLTHVFLGVDFNRADFPAVLSAIGDTSCPVWPLYYSGEWLACSKKH